jgi:HlyD family secretion protein
VYARRDDVLRVANAALRFRPTPEVLALAQGVAKGGRRTAAANGVAEASQVPGSSGRRRGSARTADTADGAPNRKTVWVLRDGVPRPISIVTGLTDGTVTEVVGGGLQEGDVLITDAYGGSGSANSGPRFGRMF